MTARSRSGSTGVYAGKLRIREYLKRLHGGQEGLIYGQLNEWVTLQPAITVADNGGERDRALAATSACSASTRSTPNGATGSTRTPTKRAWTASGGSSRLHLYVNFVAPYEKGWARLKPGEGLVQSQAAKDYPPDRPPSAVYKPFPEVQIPPFQAKHPVTGKPVKGGQ